MVKLDAIETSNVEMEYMEREEGKGSINHTVYQMGCG
jgi:hypothetical protein